MEFKRVNVHLCQGRFFEKKFLFLRSKALPLRRYVEKKF